ncbi:MAG: NAD(P)/FAD-dependent oxidoreductase [Acidobacteriota bacterium]
MIYDAIIIGGGAAGLFCALTAGQRGKRVLVIEHNAECGRKILISGGGRCNFTNRHTRPENFISSNPHFCKSALSRYSPQDFVELVQKHKIAYYEKTLGQLFCRETSRQIVDMLLAECRGANVRIRTACAVSRVAKREHFEVETSQGIVFGVNLVIASGGLSFSKIGASDFGYAVARQFGHRIIETRPSLVALVAKGGGWSQLAGLSVDSNVAVGKASFRENILFTHRGMSGPAILQISNYWKKDKSISIDLLPDMDAAQRVAADHSSRQTVANYLSQFLPQRLTQYLSERIKINKPLAQLNQAEIATIGRALNDWQVEFTATEGYDRAEVTLGGVSTNELSSKTMESKKAAGLYFIGEVVDVTGWLGGYNFQWAWSSGFAAGDAI